jgi:hypothetical protein
MHKSDNRDNNGKKISNIIVKLNDRNRGETSVSSYQPIITVQLISKTYHMYLSTVNLVEEGGLWHERAVTRSKLLTSLGDYLQTCQHYNV